MVVRSRGFPALETPCSCATDPLREGVGQSGISRNLPSVGKAADNPSDHGTPANSGPIPSNSFGAGVPSSDGLSIAFRSVSTALTAGA
jgi:hypothetical protein